MPKRRKKEEKESWGGHLRRYWQLYAMLVIPLLYFIIFKYIPMFGNVLAFRRYQPGMSPFGTKWVGFKYFEMFMRDPAFGMLFVIPLHCL